MFLHQWCTWVFPLYYQDFPLAGLVTKLVQEGVGWKVARVMEMGLVLQQVMVFEKMDFVVDFAEIVDKEKIVEDMVVGMTVGRVVGMDVSMAMGRAIGMFDSHKHILSNLEKVSFGFAKESKSTKAQEHSMNFEQDIHNFEEIDVQDFET